MWPFPDRSQQAQQQAPPSEPSAFVQDPSSSSTPGTSSSSPQHQHQSASSHFDNAQFSQASSTPPSPSSSSSYDPNYTPTATSIFSGPNFDATRLHPLSGLGKEEVEYLDIVDNQPNQLEGARTALPSRGWSDDLSYGTGTTYLSGLALGGLLGVREGLGRSLGVESPTFRLRLNAVLNQVTRRASFMGNSAGVIALIYNITDAIIDNVRGKHDMAGAIAAGGLSGAMFKATAGPRPMAVASGIMMAAAAGWTTAKQAFL
ncbi:unnamed protein product [Jaminaea pallidilutea]